MTFDFDELTRCADRSERWSVPVLRQLDGKEHLTPLAMAVGDMDFRSPPAVADALGNASRRGHFGYASGPGASYLRAIARWQADRLGWQVLEDWIVPTYGALAGLKAGIEALSRPGDAVTVLPPVYPRLLTDVPDGRELRLAPLRRRGARYEMDLDAVETAVRGGSRLVVLCNPNNPTGTVWRSEELRAVADICLRHDAYILSDEVHQDLVIGAALRHVPVATLSPKVAARTITITSASKTFNLSGLHCAHAIICNAGLRRSFTEALRKRAPTGVNLLGELAVEAAYGQGERWMKDLLDYLRANHMAFRRELEGVASLGIVACETDASYFVWLDAKALGQSSAHLQELLWRSKRVWVERGDRFGSEGEGYLRVNLASPRRQVIDAARRIDEALRWIAGQGRV